MNLPYASKFIGWESDANIKKARRIVEQEEGKISFPRELVPEAYHPLVQQLGPFAERFLLAQAAYTFLRFTAGLERKIVNPVTEQIAFSESDFEFPRQMQLDAGKIY